MPEPLTIAKEPVDDPGLDFAFLRQVGINLIQRLAGNRWTDHNDHDPGITILEQLCYAITDLSYRLSFEIEDLLAPIPDSATPPPPLFFTAREILTINPLTINDYRKLLTDIDGVKNAWLEPIQETEPAIYHDLDYHRLTFTVTERTERVNLNGLYRVFIAKDDDSQIDDTLLKQAVQHKLHQHRNLCEDFAEIQILPTEEITVTADLEIEPGFDANDLIAQIYFNLEQWISPNIKFFSLADRLAAGKSPDEIFNGPPLDHGFIDDEQLQQFDRRKALHTSDFIHILLDLDGIKTVKKIQLSSDRSPQPESWSLGLATNVVPVLKTIEPDLGITLFQGSFRHPIDLKQVKKKLKALRDQQTDSRPAFQEDLAIPQGRDRDLSTYESIQSHFPLNYGIGEHGLPSSAPAQRQAQAKQLQAYLMIFDQILANYCAQLDHVKHLFSLGDRDTSNAYTYASQPLVGLPNLAQLLISPVEEYESSLKKITEDHASTLERQNRFLDHLLAQFSEQFSDYTLMLNDSTKDDTAISVEVLSQFTEQFSEQLTHHTLMLFSSTESDKTISGQKQQINQKINWLKAYPKLSASRGQGFNYTAIDDSGKTDNLSGFHKRLSVLLGFPTQQIPLADLEQPQGFHLVEHILLRPHSPPPLTNHTDFYICSVSFLNLKHQTLLVMSPVHQAIIDLIRAIVSKSLRLKHTMAAIR